MAPASRPGPRLTWDAVGRVLAATAGAYGAGALDARGLARAFGGAPVDGATMALLSTPAVMAGLAVWCFAVRSARRAWLAVAIAALLGEALSSVLP